MARVTQIQIRRDAAANWTTAQNATTSTILAAGEIGYETDSGKLKIGDGTKLWTDATLLYVADASKISGTTLSTSVTTANGLTTATSLASVGTITTGTWNGSIIGTTYGGTNTTTGLTVLSGSSISTGTVGTTFGGTGRTDGAAAPPFYYTNYNDVSSTTVASATPIAMFKKSVALAASTVYEVDLSWLQTLQCDATGQTPRLWWSYSGTLDATNPIDWSAQYAQVSGTSGSAQYTLGELGGASASNYTVTALKVGSTTAGLITGPGYTASAFYAAKVTAKALIRTSTAGNLSFNIQAGNTAAQTGYLSFNTKAGSFMRVTPMGTNSGADFAIGTWA
jgi:hypothetical protein